MNKFLCVTSCVSYFCIFFAFTLITLFNGYMSNGYMSIIEKIFFFSGGYFLMISIPFYLYRLVNVKD